MKLNNLLETIKTICYNQPNTNTVFVGDIYDLNTQKDIEYSVMVITEQTHTVNSNDGYEVWGINLFYVDRQTSDNSNILDIHSHAVEVLNSVVNELEELGVIIENTYQINTFNERFAALCSGAYVTLNLRVPLATCDKYELVHSVNGMRGDVIINTSNPISQIEEGNTKDSVNSVAVINYVAPIKDRVSSAETNITTLQNTKQDNLISGTNIKTVNGYSLLGSGNITIDDGSNFIGKLGSYTTYLSGFLNALSAKGAVSNFQGISKDAAQVGDIFVIEAKAADTHDYYIFVLECETPKTNDVRGHTIYSYIIRDYELWSNKVTQITSASTNIQYPSAKAVFDELQKKQDTLVSGTNIKTINGNSILGSGNLVIEGGGGSDNIFWAEYGVTTFEDVNNAISNNKIVCVQYNNTIYYITRLHPTVGFMFNASVNADRVNYDYTIVLHTNSIWENIGAISNENSTNKVTQITSASTDTQYPSAKAVINYVNSLEWFGTQAEFDTITEYDENIKYYIYD